MAEGGHSEAGQDATVLHQQLEAAGTRLEELVEENEDLQIKCKELELRETTLQEVRGARGGTLLRDWSRPGCCGCCGCGCLVLSDWRWI